MTDIVERLNLDAARCEVSFSKGIAKNIKEGVAEIERLRGIIDHGVKVVSRIWQPIDAAPRDGTWILVHLKQTAIPIGVKWVPGADDEYDGWEDQDGTFYMQDQPTHWVPMPQLPEASK